MTDREGAGDGMARRTKPVGDPLVDRCMALSTPTLSNALDDLGLHGVMTGLSPAAHGLRCAGRAVTVSETTGPRGSFPPEDFRVGDIIDAASAGDVVVISNGGVPVSTWGGTATYAAKTKGVAGLIVDGAIRDREEIEEHGFPAFSRHLVPTTGKSRIRVDAIGEPVICGGVLVRPGDIILADGSGIVCLAADRAEEVIAAAEAIADADRKVMEAVDRGMTWKDAMAAASA